MDYSNHTALFQPLVGTEEQQQQQQQSPVRANEVESAPSVSTEQKSQLHNHDTWISVLLFALMYIHFGLIYYSDPNHIIHGVSWTTMNISISLFIIATFLYRHALHDCQIQSDLMMLLPEIFILVSMALVFFQDIMLAFLLLAIGKLYMAFTVIIVNSYQLWSLSATTDDDEEDNEQGEGEESKDSDSIV